MILKVTSFLDGHKQREPEVLMGRGQKQIVGKSQ
jgi:hypothetical protein